MINNKSNENLFNKMYIYIYIYVYIYIIVGGKVLNLIDYNTNIKVKNYLNLLFQKNFMHMINKPTRVLHNNATNHFLNDDMHSGIVTADIADHFSIFLISKDVILNSGD